MTGDEVNLEPAACPVVRDLAATPPQVNVEEVLEQITGWRFEPLEVVTAGGWRRRTTVVHLQGGGVEGAGEDVTYVEEDQHTLLGLAPRLDLAGRTTLHEFSLRLDGWRLFPAGPADAAYALYRRWAFESAALDLALRQAGRSLPEILERTPRPVSFVVSLGLGDPPEIERIRRVLQLYPGARFKVDHSESWTEETVAALAATGAVVTLDLKGHYRGAYEGPRANAEQVRFVAGGLPDAWIEDPLLDERTRPVLEPHRGRITWDAPIHSVADIAALPFKPAALNVKPSRFGFLSEVLRCYEFCEAQGIAMYGGGQFELGPGRGQIQALASLFHADAANDVAPSGYNERDLRPDLPASPLQPRLAATGFGWEAEVVG